MRHAAFPEIEPQLGTVPDKVIADRYAVPVTTVRWWRSRANIPPVARLTPEQEAARDAEIVRRLRAGERVNDVARGMGCSNRLVLALRRTHRIERVIRSTPEAVARWAVLVKDGHQISQIARDEGIPRATISMALHRRRRAPKPTEVLAVAAWRCLTCHARVAGADVCPNGHAAPWVAA